MKSKQQKQQKQVNALKRLQSYDYKDSKAKRLKTATKEQWQKKKDEEIQFLTKLIADYRGVYNG